MMSLVDYRKLFTNYVDKPGTPNFTIPFDMEIIITGDMCTINAFRIKYIQ